MFRRLAIVMPLILLLSTGMVVADPIVTTNITVANGVKTYTYHITNPEGSGYTLTGFDLTMPEAGARSVIDFTCTLPGWTKDFRFDGSYSYWLISGVNLWEGCTGDFQLTTAADVPTAYNYMSPDGNWGWTTLYYTQAAQSSLPVPGSVPEPSSLAALGLAISGVGTALMRRRRK